MKRVHVIVFGYVQGIGYRQACADVAEANGVAGWIRNLEGGQVEAVFEGPAAGVDALLDWVWEGPDDATVQDVSIDKEKPQGISGFEIQ